MNDTVITVLGNVGSDIRQVVTAKGALLTSFRLASTPRWSDKQTGEWVDGTTTWYSVVAWRNLADNVAASLDKGDPVLVHGRLRTVAWERDGRTGETLEIEALSVGPDLNRGRATYRRVIRPVAGRMPGPTSTDAVDGADGAAGADGAPSAGADEDSPSDAPADPSPADPSPVDTDPVDTDPVDTDPTDGAHGASRKGSGVTVEPDLLVGAGT